MSRDHSSKDVLTSVTVKIKVNPTLSSDELYWTLLIALETQHKTPERVHFYRVEAYPENDSKLKNSIASVFQTTNGGMLSYKYKEETILRDDRYASVFPEQKSTEQTPSREERERQREVGKFAGELMKEAEKIRNNR